MRKIGIFQIKTSFNLSGRGIVAVGTFVEGKAPIGSTSHIAIEGRITTVKIRGIERGNPDAEGKLPFGLLLSFKDESFQKIVETVKLKEQTIDILAE
ncbi:MAG TPA: hypothetical protein VNS58_02365 [Puia sp.]|nr:hypothetical protein [Puia sp.]